MSNEMNIQEILASGLLESWVLGTTSAEENVKVQQWMQLYPEIEQAVKELELDLESVLQKDKQDIPLNLKQEIYSKTINQDAPTPTAPAKSGATIMAYSMAFATLILFGLVLYLNTIQQKANRKLDQMEQDMRLLNDRCEEIAQGFDFLSDPSTLKITLASTGLKSEAEATVWYNTNSDRILYSTAGLPELTTDQSYQLWAIIDGVPADLGVIERSPDGKVISIRFTGVAQAFAITIEPAGGSEGPTLDQMVVIGTSS